ncbi:hypothetical protein K504DRAFT_28287 [Pleomassaria siparia CBS 279.74]|uniref:Uncharacterized protein n=1 Tax=Pleomassaria siparia CBS 279.74 TaxID=1314801 RepID=A0A6G1KRN1_9PLEO|nr:hypothetical protein K504DRAFT_28287 [Pleomassaria siparia CBS 279.74]
MHLFGMSLIDLDCITFTRSTSTSTSTSSSCRLAPKTCRTPCPALNIHPAKSLYRLSSYVFSLYCVPESTSRVSTSTEMTQIYRRRPTPGKRERRMRTVHSRQYFYRSDDGSLIDFGVFFFSLLEGLEWKDLIIKMRRGWMCSSYSKVWGRALYLATRGAGRINVNYCCRQNT